MKSATYTLSAIQGSAEAAGYLVGLLVGIPILAGIIALVLGGLYYLAERPRITYSQAVGRWWILALSFLVAVVWTPLHIAG